MPVRRGVLRVPALARAALGALGLAALLGGATSSLAAQFVARVRWPLVDVLVRGDSTGKFEIVAAPNLLSTQGTGPSTPLSRLPLPPLEALQWATLMRRLVDSVADLPRGITRLLFRPNLNEANGEGAIHLGAAFEASLPPFRFMVMKDKPDSGWQVAITAGEARELLDAVAAVAGAVVLPERRVPALIASGAHPGCPIPDTVTVTEDDVESRPAMLRGRIAYPRTLYPRRGRVWLQYVVDTAGRFKPGSHCVLLSDHDAFTAAVLRALPRFRFRPARLNGAAVPVLVCQEFRFMTRRE